MKIQFNTDASINGHEALATRVVGMVEQTLSRFGDELTRVEVHVSDENAGKGGANDQRCMLEARLKGRQPVAVTETAATLGQAVQGAADKLARLLDSTIGRAREPRAVGAGLQADEPGAP